MGDWLQTSANIVQIVGGLWVLFLGGKTVFDFTKQIRQKQPLHISVSPLTITNLLSVVILILLIGTYFRSAGNCSQAAPSQQPPSSSSSFQAPVNTPISIPTDVPTVSAGTVQKNVQLTCGGCDDPMIVTVDSIMIDPSNSRMKWSITLFNNSMKALPVYFDIFQLKNTVNESLTYDGSGDLRTFHCVSCDGSLAGGQKETSEIIFSFVPLKGISYQLKVHEASSFSYEINIAFDPVLFTF